MRRHPRVEQRQQRLKRGQPNPRTPFGQHVGAQRHHRAGFGHRQRFTHSGRVTAQQIELQCRQLVVGNAHLRQRPKTRVDAIHSRGQVGMPIHNRA